ncbi:MAG: tetratricopeptide repeat protein [Sedimentisphaerales bacterium]|jgi:tetratricopeptide (TPR) repeat protein
MIEQLSNHRRLLICILLAAVTFAVYLPVRNYEFLHYDDDVYVTNNTEVKSGLSWQGVKWAFTTGHGSNWHPLTWLSLMLDCQLFGVKSGPMHIVNVLFHIANTILLFLVLARMTKGVWQSVFIAGLFALHPLHVESVAWVAERKDVLSTLFWLLTMLAYARYAERSSAGRYIVMLVLFAMGLLAKPMLVTLPFVLLLLDYWPLGRFSSPGLSVKGLLLEKLPLLILSIASSVVTFIVQQHGGAVIASNRLLLDERVINAIVSYLTYIGKMIWPTQLAVLYPHPVNTIPVSRAVIYGTILVLITIFFVCYCRRHKYLIVGWLWYLGTLVPVIGIVQVGSQAMADRYTYIPLIGIFIIIAFGVTELLKERPFGKIALGVLAGVSLSACAVVTSGQLKYWKDSLSLFEHTLNVVKDSSIMENNYANILSDLGRPKEAAAQLSEALKFLPNSPEIHNNYGNALREMGKLDEAIAQYKIVIKLNPDFKLARYNLGLALAAKGDYEGAIQQYQLYAGTSVDVADIHQGLGAQLAKEGKADDAVGQFQKALIVKPNSAEVLSNFGFALAQSGKPKEAIEYYNKVLAKDPNNVITHGRLALALASVGRISEAIEQCRIVLVARPNDFEMHNNLGMLLQNQGKLDQAIESYKKALQINPNFRKSRENLDAALAQKQAGK